MNQPTATLCRKGHLAEYRKLSGGHSSAPDLLQQLTLTELTSVAVGWGGEIAVSTKQLTPL